VTEKLKTVVLLSGSGTTLQNLIDRVEKGELPIDIILVVSSREGVYGIERAKKHGIPVQTIARKQFDSWGDFNRALSQAMDDADPGLIVFAGFMSLFRPDEKFYDRIVNVHPALIPSFCGKGMYGHHVHEAVIESGVKITGATVHFVDQNYDTGPIILQKPVDVLDDDTPDSLAERVQAAEREIYPQAIKLFAEKRLVIDGRRVKIFPPK